MNSQIVLEKIKNLPPEISVDGVKIILPKVNDGFKVTLYGSSNKTVIDLDGNIYSPLFDTTVSVMYCVTNISNPDDVAVDNFSEVSLIVPGIYKRQGENKKPQVLPTIREWKGDKGKFVLKENSVIYYKDASLKEIAEKIAFYFEKMLGKIIRISDTKGDIVLEISQKSELGEEGYYAEITEDNVVISAPETKGVLYGGTTITQILFDKKSVPCGIIRDYPQYPVRSFMLDLGRTYVSLDYLYEFVRYAAYFKINQIHMHINDNGGETRTAFRVESKKFPQINSTLNEGQMFYQEDYKAFQKVAESFGIEIMNEIDTPGHCAFIDLYDKELCLRGMMDITTEEKLQKSLKFIKELIDEMVDGEDPVFRGKKLHIGNDEYWVDGMHEQQRKYLNELINYLNEKGITPQYWGVLGGEEGSGVTGKTPVSNKAILNFWIDAATNPALMIEQGHRFVNSDVREALYICPSNPFYGSQMQVNAEYNYDKKNVNKVVGYEMPMASPLLLGYEPAFWNDDKSGISQLDVFESMKNAILFVAEKTWHGKNTGEMTGKDFVKLIEKFGNFAPGANPSKYYPANNEGIIADFVGTLDMSGNGHTMTLNGVSEITENGKNVLVFDGNSYASIDIKEIGYGNTISMDIYIDEKTPADTLLFANDNTKIFLNYCGSGKIGYERQGYSFVFDYVLDTNRMQNIKITTALRDDERYYYDSNRMFDDNIDNAVIEKIHIVAGLCVDGVFVSKGYYCKEEFNHFNSSSLSIPFEKIGEGFIGKIGGIEIIGKDTFPSDANGKGIVNAQALYSNLKKITQDANDDITLRLNQILSVYDYAKTTTEKDVILLLEDRFEKLEKYLSQNNAKVNCKESETLLQAVTQDIYRKDYTTESFEEFRLARLVGVSVFCNFESDCAAFAAAVKRIETAKEKIVKGTPKFAIVTSNRCQWTDHPLSNMLEDNDELFYWQNGPQIPNDRIVFEFNKPIKLSKFTLISCGDDRLNKAEFQITKDGTNWETVGDLSDMEDSRTLEFEENIVTAARILIKAHSLRWVKIKRVIFN